ncbi:ATP-binding cassette domain-containing protein [Azospirillum sp. A29]|uniref:ABC transporter ATP-binding protein n=1 Tax=Azospirillum sp. A29 TaxID=3160606 RepID=UPI00366BB0EB
MNPLLTVRDLRKDYTLSQGLFRKPTTLHAVDGVSFELNRGEVMGLVGESGSGKTTVGRSILRLVEPTSGTVIFDGTDVTRASGATLKELRRKMQIIFQDPYGSLDPRRTVGAQIEVAFRIHRLHTPQEQRRRAERLLDRVGLPRSAYDRYPHEFSGGQRQRIGIARALALEPKLIVADESVSALDVSVQAQVVNLLLDLRDELDLTLLFISHDLALIEYICDRVLVMYRGSIVESGSAHDIYRNPQHAYTQALLAAIPIPDPSARRPALS